MIERDDASQNGEADVMQRVETGDLSSLVGGSERWRPQTDEIEDSCEFITKVVVGIDMSCDYPTEAGQEGRLSSPQTHLMTPALCY